MIGAKSVADASVADGPLVLLTVYFVRKSFRSGNGRPEPTCSDDALGSY